MTTKEVQLVPLAKTMETGYRDKLELFLGDPKKAMSFIVSVDTAIRRNPALANVTPKSLISAFLKGAELKLMPSEVMAQFYVIPYGKEANFQLGYQGVIELLNRADVSINVAEIVRENDDFSIKNGVIEHNIDWKISEKERGKIVGVYVIASKGNQVWSKYMNIKDIIAHGQKYSKAFNTKFSPWKTDPQWMYKKTVILQLSKILPKSADLIKALEYEYETDSTIRKNQARLNNAKELSKKLTMGNNEKENYNQEVEDKEPVIDITEDNKGE